MNDQVAWHKIFFRNSILGGKLRVFFGVSQNFILIYYICTSSYLQNILKSEMNEVMKKKECKNLDHQITFRKVSSEVADVAEGNADDFFHERFALSN